MLNAGFVARTGRWRLVGRAHGRAPLPGVLGKRYRAALNRTGQAQSLRCTVGTIDLMEVIVTVMIGEKIQSRRTGSTGSNLPPGLDERRPATRPLPPVSPNDNPVPRETPQPPRAVAIIGGQIPELRAPRDCTYIVTGHHARVKGLGKAIFESLVRSGGVASEPFRTWHRSGTLR